MENIDDKTNNIKNVKIIKFSIIQRLYFLFSNCNFLQKLIPNFEAYQKLNKEGNKKIE